MRMSAALNAMGQVNQRDGTAVPLRSSPIMTNKPVSSSSQIHSSESCGNCPCCWIMKKEIDLRGQQISTLQEKIKDLEASKPPGKVLK